MARCRLCSTALLAADWLILCPDRLALAIVPALLIGGWGEGRGTRFLATGPHIDNRGRILHSRLEGGKVVLWDETRIRQDPPAPFLRSGKEEEGEDGADVWLPELVPLPRILKRRRIEFSW